MPDETRCRMGYMNNFASGPYLAKVYFADSTAAKLFSLVPTIRESYYEEGRPPAPTTSPSTTATRANSREVDHRRHD